MKQPRSEQLKREMQKLTGEKNHLPERFASEIEFIEKFVKLYPQKEKTWNKLIAKASEVVSTAISSGKVDRVAKAVKGAEEILAPVGKIAKTYTIHCVGHAHIDMNWMWSWPETVAVTNDTFITVLKLMDEFPEFRFTQSQASVYAIIKEYNPELYEQIKERVREGRWEIAASHWVEGDKNLVSGESLARHLLYTRRFIKDEFGLAPEDIPLEWEPDTFGHAWTIPAIASRGGVRRYYMCRGGQFDKPPVFWWKSPDGSKILVNMETTWYNDSLDTHNAPAMVEFCAKTKLKDWMCVYGVGDHGGGPTHRDIRRALDMDTWPIYPRFKFATTENYYKLLEKNSDDLPVLDCELNFEFTGCYTSQAAIKKVNRLGENQLEQAESAAVLAYRIAQREYPAESIRQGWINTLFGHFHDILPGSGVRATREYQLALFQKTSAMTGMVKTNSYREITKHLDTSFGGKYEINPEKTGIAMGAGAGRGAGIGDLSSASHLTGGPRAVTVFNPTAWKRNEVVQTSIWDTDTEIESNNVQKKTFIVKTPDGESIPAQKTGEGDYWGHKYIDLAFPASVEAMGYSTYIIEEGLTENFEGGVKVDDQFAGGEQLQVGSYKMENEFLSVDFDKESGGIIKLLDKTTGIDLAEDGNPIGILEYILERPGTMSSWVIHDTQRCICPIEVISFEKKLRGPHTASVAATMKINESDVTVTYTLKASQPWIEIDIETTWLERGGPDMGIPNLTIKFPLAITDAKPRYEIPFGTIERNLNKREEVPSLRWADVSGKIKGKNISAGLTLLNDCKYGHSLEDATLRLSLIRSSYEPDPLPEIGKHSIRIAIMPHGKKPSEAKLIQSGAGFNHNLQVVSTDIHQGSLPATSSAIVSCQPDNAIITNIKKAEDDDAIIFRILETAGKNTTAKIQINPQNMGQTAEAIEVDFLEGPLKTSSAKITKDGFSVKLIRHGIASVKVQFAATGE